MKLIFSILTLLFAVTEAMAQPLVEWYRFHPWFDHPFGTMRICITSDGGYFVAGSTLGLGHSYAMKLDSVGDTLWVRQLALPSGETVAAGAFEIEGELILISGWGTQSIQTGYVIESFDAEGNLNWEELVNPGPEVTSAKLTSDGGIVLSARTRYDSIWVQTRNSQLVPQWVHSFAPAGTWRAIDVAQASDGTFGVAGGSTIMRLDALGDTLWRTAYPGYLFFSINTTSDGGFLLTGVGEADIVRTDSNGAILWSYTDSVSRYTCSVVDPENNIIVGGWTGTSLWPGATLRLLGLSDQGDSLWSYSENDFGGGGYTVFTMLQPDGRIVACFGGSMDWGSTTSPIVMRFCPLSSNAAIVAPLGGESPQLQAFRLIHRAGAVSSFVLTALPPGSSGAVGGEASGFWSVLPNGDGNDGDSIVFEASVPLAEGSIDSFYLLTSSSPCSVSWSAHCGLDSLHLFHGSAQLMQWYAQYTPPHTTIHVLLSQESYLAYIELRRFVDYQEEVTVVTFPAYGDSSEHNYEYVETSPLYSASYRLSLIDSAGCQILVPDTFLYVIFQQVSATTPSPPESYSVAAYPNPFNGAAEIRLVMFRQTNTSVQVNDLLGRHITTLHDGMLEPGEHSFTFDASALPSGIYFARVQTGEFVKTQKLLLLK